MGEVPHSLVVLRTDFSHEHAQGIVGHGQLGTFSHTCRSWARAISQGYVESQSPKVFVPGQVHGSYRLRDRPFRFFLPIISYTLSIRGGPST